MHMHINKKKGFIFRAAGGNLPCFAEERFLNFPSTTLFALIITSWKFLRDKKCSPYEIHFMPALTAQIYASFI